MLHHSHGSARAYCTPGLVLIYSTIKLLENNQACMQIDGKRCSAVKYQNLNEIIECCIQIRVKYISICTGGQQHVKL